jgi:hypothetical protein
LSGNSRAPPSPTLAAAILIAGGLIGLFNLVGIVALSVGIFAVCFSTIGCSGSVGLALALYWALLGLALATVACSLIFGLTLARNPRFHRSMGWIVVGLSLATLAALYALLGPATWWIIALLGGWSLFLMMAGGLLAVLWRPVPPPWISGRASP